MNARFTTEPLHQVACDVLVVGVRSTEFADGATPTGALADLNQRFDGKLIADLKARRFGGGEGSVQTIPTFGRIASATLVIVGLGDGGPTASRTAAGRAGREARSLRASTVVLALGATDAATALDLVETAAGGSYVWQDYKPEDDRAPAVQAWITAGVDAADATDVAASIVRVKWQDYARDLVNLPPADLYPESLAAKARELAALPGVEVEVWDIDRCQAEGCVGIVAVGQGSTRPGCLIHVKYRPDNAVKHVALVGKGVTFDAGGLSLKPSSAMQTMRCDMGGAATMLGAAGAIAELGLPVALDCIVGAVENMVSGDSYKLGDILRYSNGVSVEIHNTDAEGRLVLADCLIQAAAIPGVEVILDAATLTGAAVVAVGPDFTGLFTDDDALATSLLASADDVGEGLWRLPLHAPYKELLKSDFAQIKNVGGRAAGATTAALFLQYFVPDDGPTWAHLDIAGPAFLDKANARYAPGGTGQMVRTLVSWTQGWIG